MKALIRLTVSTAPPAQEEDQRVGTGCSPR
jgi:hypothetical protein